MHILEERLSAETRTEFSCSKLGYKHLNWASSLGDLCWFCLTLNFWLEMLIMFLCKIRIGLNPGSELSLQVLLVTRSREEDTARRTPICPGNSLQIWNGCHGRGSPLRDAPSWSLFKMHLYKILRLHGYRKCLLDTLYNSVIPKTNI